MLMKHTSSKNFMASSNCFPMLPSELLEKYRLLSSATRDSLVSSGLSFTAIVSTCSVK